MRRLERYCYQAVVDAAIDVFLADWNHEHEDIEVSIKGVSINELGTMLHIDLLVDVFERQVDCVLYSDISTCAAHIYENLKKISDNRYIGGRI